MKSSAMTVQSEQKPRYMRDVFIDRIYAGMHNDRSLFFLAADCGAPSLDKIRSDFPDRFINLGIAEQNLINVAAGLALEGFSVYAYAIAPFITMRCYEQIRVNLALLSTVRKMNVTLLGLGAGFSYAVSGPSHQALEDITVIRALPNIELVSPADPVTAECIADLTMREKGIRYVRIDGAPSNNLYRDITPEALKRGFISHGTGASRLIISTGFMTRKALEIRGELEDVDVIDIFMLKHPDEAALAEIICQYQKVVTWEEGFSGKGGLDSLIMNIMRKYRINIPLDTVGIEDKYVFEMGSREELHAMYGAGKDKMLEALHR